jgi:hypothetical protein
MAVPVAGGQARDAFLADSAWRSTRVSSAAGVQDDRAGQPDGQDMAKAMIDANTIHVSGKSGDGGKS